MTDPPARTNYFAPPTAAVRYARGRHFFHPLVIERAREFLSLARPVGLALDVGCGTGLSAVALKRIAARVVGVDASRAMVARAPREPGISYVVARAERLPFGADAFELLTLSQVFHWLDRAAFFREARRVLRAGGWVVAYDDYMTGRMEGRDEFEVWFRESYKPKYPAPLRRWTSFDPDETAREGFRLVAHERHPNTVRFTPAALADYLLSQSNVIAAVEGGTEDAAEVRAWMLDGLAPVFGDAADANFLFDAPVWFLQKSAGC